MITLFSQIPLHINVCKVCLYYYNHIVVHRNQSSKQSAKDFSNFLFIKWMISWNNGPSHIMSEQWV